MTAKSSEKTRKFRIRITLPTAVAILIGITVITVIGINYVNTSRSMRELANAHLSQIGRQTFEKTLNHMEKAERLIRLNRSISKSDIFNINFAKIIDERHKINQLNTMIQLFRTEMGVYESMAMIYLGDETGNFWMLRRMPDGAMATKNIIRPGLAADCDERLAEAGKLAAAGDKDAAAQLTRGCIQTTWIYRDLLGRVVKREKDPADTYDPRIRPWYRAAKQNGKMSWTDVYVFHSGQKPGITVAMPVFDGEEFLGAVGIDIELDEISEFLKSLKIGQKGRAFIVSADGGIVAFPDPTQLQRKDEATGRLIPNHILRVSDRGAAASFRAFGQLSAPAAPNGSDPKKERLFSFKENGTSYIAMYMPFPEEYPWNWTIGVIMPEDDFLGDVKRNNLMIAGISLLGMFVAIAVALGLSRTITRPLTELAEETNRIREFDLEGQPDAASPFDEIERMNIGFANMKTGLRSFRKFVPADLVRYLIRNGVEAELGGENRELTLLFSDIADFTTMSEQLAPQDLVEQLGEYLEAMSRIVHDHNGTVDKYIGDAIMAFWNAPRHVADHPAAACRTALAMNKKLESLRKDWKQRGLPAFKARIGIHSGAAVVGNIGSRNRLNYTAMGDNVNLASRLEGIGKYYGVYCTVSGDTFDKVNGEFIARRLDRIAVKGKNMDVAIFELLGEKERDGNRFSALIEKYEKALDAYCAGRWNDALSGFEQADESAGPKGDPPSRVMMARCRDYLAHPPENWDGVCRFDSK